MELALYAPGLGYYSAGSTKIGSGGDFVTAPEVSGLFSRCVARQCAQVLARTGGDILELGAGTGRMAAVILRELAAGGRAAARYLILEVSADLAARQRALLDGLPPRCARGCCGSIGCRRRPCAAWCSRTRSPMRCPAGASCTGRRGAGAGRSARSGERHPRCGSRHRRPATRAACRPSSRSRGAAARWLCLGSLPAAHPLDREPCRCLRRARSCCSTTACRGATTTIRSGARHAALPLPPAGAR